ncbi:E3 ubiquitin-protein ligase MARCH5 [Cyphellophora attinorum]|uniref:E3 ubiquitin-protein ligase MARCH5 n=1 Tax=Cyphellophora attinorum TaxID=1664694 RepID=A0A0N1H279_9EURO|nr:E3 ubiquitin-protein ligase MARCH5 [Phialophora attinorum]KPI34292.1 E3 ubiquitin-protein ligase MARCH5 [Phialophora attinorum]
MSSDTSEPVLLDKPDDESPPPSRPVPLTRQSTLTPKKCWVCLGTQDEDDPNNPPVWRSPCTCSLTGHEACYLDWIADVENPKKKPRGDTTIRCPQCKTEIKVARPSSRALDVVKALDRAFAKATLPGLAGVIIGMITTGAWAHGFQSMYFVFGPDEAARIFLQSNTIQLCLYPLIPLNLIAARTRYADPVLHTGTFALLYSQINQHGFQLDLTIWPPLPSTVFICLPTVRRIYNWSYEKLFGEFNKRMIQAVQPQATQPIDTEEANLQEIANQNAIAEAEEAEIVLELQVDIGDGEVEVQAEAVEAGNEGEANPEQGNNGNQAHVHQIGEIVDGLGFGSNLLGALAFPYVSAAMGYALNLALPKSWTSPLPGSFFRFGKRPGLLQSQWGRSVVGGAIFLVLKDALLLYSRWKQAQSHKQRRVVDYDKKTKRYLDGS